MMKKIAIILLSALLFLLSSAGCAGNATANTRVSIPSDGIVRADAFARMQGKSVISIFSATDGSYEWTFLGTKITAPKDANLALTLEDDCGDSFALAFGSYLAFELPDPERLPGMPTLSIRNFGTDGARYLYQFENGQPVYRKTLRVLDGRCSFSLENLSAGAAVISDKRPENLPDGFDEAYRDPDKIPADPSATPMVTITIHCQTALDNWDSLDPQVKDHRIVPADGVILATTELYVKKGDSVYDALVAVTKNNPKKQIHMESVTAPLKNGVYIKGINNLYEFDGGNLSGWMYSVNGWYPGYGCSRYMLRDGDKIEWNYTCDLGRDLGQGWLA